MMILTIGRYLVALASTGLFAALTIAPGLAQSISECSQTIQYVVAPPAADVPPEMKAFSGVWLGNWGNQMCSVLIVENVGKDGAVTTKYAWGANPGWNIRQPGVRQWSGKIVGGVLTLTGNNVSAQFRAADAQTLAATYTTTSQTSGTFKRR